MSDKSISIAQTIYFIICFIIGLMILIAILHNLLNSRDEKERVNLESFCESKNMSFFINQVHLRFCYNELEGIRKFYLINYEGDGYYLTEVGR